MWGQWNGRGTSRGGEGRGGREGWGGGGGGVLPYTYFTGIVPDGMRVDFRCRHARKRDFLQVDDVIVVTKSLVDLSTDKTSNFRVMVRVRVRVRVRVMVRVRVRVWVRVRVMVRCRVRVRVRIRVRVWVWVRVRGRVRDRVRVRVRVDLSTDKTTPFSS